MVLVSVGSINIQISQDEFHKLEMAKHILIPSQQSQLKFDENVKYFAVIKTFGDNIRK